MRRLVVRQAGLVPVVTVPPRDDRFDQVSWSDVCLSSILEYRRPCRDIARNVLDRDSVDCEFFERLRIVFELYTLTERENVVDGWQRAVVLHAKQC